MIRSCASMSISKKTKSNKHYLFCVRGVHPGAFFIAPLFKRINYKSMHRDEAEILALKALTYLAGLDEMMDRFSALSGIAAGDLIDRAGDAEMLSGVLDFFLSDEGLLTEFCEVHEIDPETPAQARLALPGGDLPHWT